MVKPDEFGDETRIAWTRETLDEGYFIFWTPRREHYERLLKKIGGEDKLLECSITHTPKGAFRSAFCRVPATYLEGGGFSVRCRASEEPLTSFKEVEPTK